MPSQQQETLEMISNLKKALRREKESPSSEPIYGTSNRGNKLKKGANHVHLGTLANTNGPEPYKQRIEHAGFTRYILERKPPRYNDYGDELSNYDSDEDPDTYAAAETDPYEGIRLEELLRPLTHPSELATHPTLSLPYLDPALPEMVKTAEENLRQERANLWRAKALNRQLLGDEAWMPLSVVESPDDWDLFEPRPENAGHASKRRKLNGETHHAPNSVGEDAAPPDVAHVAELGGVMSGIEGDADAPQVSNGSSPPPPDVEHVTVEVTEGMNSAEGDAMASDGESPAPPPRRITRALAAGNNSNSGSSSLLSPSPTLTSSDSSLLQVDPIYLLPPAIHATNRLSALYGLPADEAVETRKLLTAYIQKQEECVRGLETVAAKLVSALKLRKDVWDMCKAEGHVGELSDGEDWVDAEAWGLKEGELRKGRFEEEDIQEEREAIGGGRKGKRRRREQN